MALSLKMMKLDKILHFNWIILSTLAQCARMDLNKRFLPKPMTTTGHATG